MAFVDIVGFGPDEAALFNVEQSVGADDVIERGDVRLVQYPLRAHYGARAGGVAMDGWGGPATNAWISTFQKDIAAQGNKILADGRFDRAFGETSSASRTVCGIYLVNLCVARRNSGAHATLPRAVAINPTPREPLQSQLFRRHPPARHRPGRAHERSVRVRLQGRRQDADCPRRQRRSGG